MRGGKWALRASAVVARLQRACPLAGRTHLRCLAPPPHSHGNRLRHEEQNNLLLHAAFGAVGAGALRFATATAAAGGLRGGAPSVTFPPAPSPVRPLLDPPPPPGT